jgi:crotonobetainyl-CoA:carnitine CoA-transferase CaiB-like acyl-CoA transferase
MSSEGPLSDLTVVELTVHRAGPYCGSFLSDMGADVIKVERPGVGDPSRHIGPGPEGRSGYFIANNRGKRSVTIDLKTEAGREAALELVADADVVVENFALGVPEKLGLDYEAARAVNEDLVYASIKGYGETGELKDKKGLDLIIQAESGIMSVTGPKGGDPVKVGTSIVDMSTGLLATIGILAKLHERDQGRGPGSEEAAPDATGKFDVGLLDMAVSLMNAYPTQYEMTGEVPGRQGVAHQTAVPYQLFDTADGEIITGVASDRRWDEFVDVLGREELREYETNHERVEHKERVLTICQDEFAKHPTEHWLDVLTEAGFPNAPLNDVADITEYEQLRERGALQSIEDPDCEELLVPGLPINFQDFDSRVDRHAPRLGEHTREVFADVAPSQTTLDEWTDHGAFD